MREKRPFFFVGIPGYCSLEYPGGKCEFECAVGPPIRSFCTPDGTWSPYPTCQGDIRETKDGCDPCPGPFGGPRNRTAERLGGGGGFGAAQPSAPAALPARRNQQNNNNFPRQPAAPATRGRPRPAVIQPARQTGFTSAPKPASFGGRVQQQQQPQRQQFRQQQQQQAPNSIDVQPGFRKVEKSSGNRGFQQQRPNSNRNNNRNNFGSSRNNNNNRNNFGSGSSRGNNNNRNNFGGNSRSTNRNNFSNSSRNSNNNNRNNSLSPAPSVDGRCPGGALDVCIDVCPSFTARIFGACVAGCARRCPSKK